MVFSRTHYVPTRSARAFQWLHVPPVSCRFDFGRRYVVILFELQSPYPGLPKAPFLMCFL